ncbi:hypothetical protein Tco_0904678, partial [Tanacetum coccineum]
FLLRRQRSNAVVSVLKPPLVDATSSQGLAKPSPRTVSTVL